MRTNILNNWMNPKRLFFMSFTIGHFIASAYGQTETITYYYDSEWKGVADSTYATYKRHLIIPKDTMFKKQVLDFYITGERQGEGSFISIDKYDNEKSVFDGKCITYYKNGKKKSECTYINGILEGDMTTYFETGAVNSKNNFVRGVMHGLQIYFTEGAQTCIKEEYDMGEHIKPYYTCYYPDGTSSRFNYSDNKPYYDTPRLRDEVFSDGIHIVRLNDIEIRVQVLYDNAWFNHYELLVNIINNSGNTITFDPSETKLALFKKGLTYDSGLHTYSAMSGHEVEKFIIQKKQMAAGLIGALNSIQAGFAGQKTTSIESNGTINYSAVSQGRAIAYGNGGYASGSSTENYSGNGNYQSQTTTHSYNSTEAFQARMLAQQQMQTIYNQIPNSAQQFTKDYLNRCSIHPGEFVSGQYWIPCDGHINKKRSYILIIKVEGIDYLFSIRLRDGTDQSGQTEYIGYNANLSTEGDNNTGDKVSEYVEKKYRY